MSVLRIDTNGDMTIKGKLHTDWVAFDDAQLIDENRMIDENQMLDDEDGFETILEYLLGFNPFRIPVTGHTFIDIHGELITPSLTENTSNTTFKPDGITLKGVLIEEGL